MRPALTLCGAWFVLASAACDKQTSDRYQLIRDENYLIRLDKHEGEIAVIHSDGVRLFNTTNLAIIANTPKIAEPPLSMKVMRFEFPESKGKMRSKVDYKWRGGKLLYRLHLEPYSEAVHRCFVTNANSMSLWFVDSDGFKIVEAPVNFLKLIRISGDSGMESGWENEGDVVCNKEDFRLIDSVNYTWKFAPELKATLADMSTNAVSEPTPQKIPTTLF